MLLQDVLPISTNQILTRSIIDNSCQIFDNGEYKFWKSITSICKDKIVFEVGAAVTPGEKDSILLPNDKYGSVFLDVFKSAKKIHAFDPRPISQPSWLTIIDHSKFQNNIIANNIGLSNFNGPLCPEKKWGKSKYSTDRTFTCKKPKDYCIEEGIGDISFIKFDVEGMECMILSSDQKFLLEHANIIQFEVNLDSLNWTNTSFFDVLGLFDKTWHIYIIFSGGLIPINQDEDLDKFILGSETATNWVASKIKLEDVTDSIDYHNQILLENKIIR